MSLEQREEQQSKPLSMSSIEVDLGNAGYKIMANLYEDGDQWCVSIGDMPNGCFGFGYTIGYCDREAFLCFANADPTTSR